MSPRIKKLVEGIFSEKRANRWEGNMKYPRIIERIDDDPGYHLYI